MSITITANYRDTLAPETLALIDKYLDEQYALDDILQFIDEYSEVTFQDCYEQYVELGEDYGYEAVDAFMTLTSTPPDLGKFTDCYIGNYATEREMAIDYFDEDINDIHHCVEIDWFGTAQNLLENYVDRVGTLYFRSSYYY